MGIKYRLEYIYLQLKTTILTFFVIHWYIYTYIYWFNKELVLCSNMDGIHGNDAGMQMVDADDAVHMHYDHHLHGMHGLSNGNGMNDGEEHDDGGNGGGSDGMMEGDGGLDHGAHSNNHGTMVVDHVENGDQLTLSFQGQVYVFDSVSPEKVIFFFSMCKEFVLFRH